MRLRLDEGGGEVLKNSAPHAQTSEFPDRQAEAAMGRDNLAVAGYAHGDEHAYRAGPDGDYEWNQAFSSGGWFMVRSAPNYHLDSAKGALLAKMDTTQHNRGWDLSLESGNVVVNLVNQGPKDLPNPKPPAKQKPVEIKEVFQYPTPSDLTKQDLAPNKPKEKKEAKKKKEEKKKKKPEKPKAERAGHDSVCRGEGDYA
jgi:hypothetical protein